MASASHARLSASGSHRWLNCPGSVRLEETLPDSTSVFAEEGTRAHALAEDALNIYLKTKNERECISFLETCPDKEMASYVSNYVDHAINLIVEFELKKLDTEAHIEEMVDFSKWVKGGFGTIDFLLMAEGKLIIRDLKYGKGVPVDSLDNSQLILYALGAIDKYDFLYDFKEVSIGIIQPRLDNISITNYDIEDILNFGKEFKVKASITDNPNAPIVPGVWCKFCKARAICKKRVSYYLNKIVKYVGGKK